MPTYNLTRWPKIIILMRKYVGSERRPRHQRLNKWQAPFTNEDIMKTGNPAMINIVRNLLMCIRRLRTHIRRFRTDIRKLLTENMKMKNQQRGFKRWLLRKKCREPFTLHFLSVNCLVSVFYMGEGLSQPFTTLHYPSLPFTPLKSSVCGLQIDSLTIVFYGCWHWTSTRRTDSKNGIGEG